MTRTAQNGELRRLWPRNEASLAALIEEFPERDIYMRGLVGRVGVALPPDLGILLGWWVDGRLIGAFLHGPVVVMCCEDPIGLAAFAERTGYYWYEQPVAQLMAPRSMSEVFLAALADHFGTLPPLNLLRHRMLAMRLRRGMLRSHATVGLEGPMTAPPLRRGLASEEAVLGELAQAVTLEDLGLDPLVFAPASFWVALQHRIRLGREYLWLKGGRPVFRAALSAVTPDTVLVEGVYVPPEFRAKGYGKAGMHALCLRLLEQHECVVLLVGEDNDGARRLYERLGFETFDEYQAAFFDLDRPVGGAGLGSGARP